MMYYDRVAIDIRMLWNLWVLKCSQNRRSIPTRKGGGVLRCGSGQKRGSLPRHIHILDKMLLIIHLMFVELVTNFNEYQYFNE